MVMKIENKKLIFILSIMIAVILTVGHALNNKILLLGAICMFLGITVFTDKQFFLPIMLFFLPWSPVLKTSAGSFTFFTLVVPIVFLAMIINGLLKQWKYKLVGFIIPLYFMAYTLLVKWFNDLTVDRSYIYFIVMVFFITFYASSFKEKIRFETCVLFLSAGVMTACLAAKILMNFPHMIQYINVYEWKRMGLTRLSGFYGDANFYSVHILVAIAAIFITIRKTEKAIVIALKLISIIGLVYFGMLSVSKMFLLCLVLLGLLWLLCFFFEKRSIVSKFKILFGLMLVLGIAVTSNIFSQQIDQYLIRFGMVTDTDSLTTGRSGLVQMYIEYLTSSISNLFLGMGLSMKYVSGSSSHNTFIQIVYQVGIFGSILLIACWAVIYRSISNKIMLKNIEKVYFLIILVAIFLPWLSLEMLYFDEFFYLTLFAMTSKNYLTERNHEESIQTTAEMIVIHNEGGV